MRPPDALFADPRLAALYDVLDGERDDLDAYVALAAEVSARVVVDVGCGTGSLALRLASRGLQVIGVDPAGASLDVARSKPDAGRVTWVQGDVRAAVAPGTRADLVVMTGNVAQVFVTDDDWARTLEATYAVLRPGGWLVLETRDPAARDWESWELDPTPVDVEGSVVTVSRTVTDVAPPLVTFVWSFLVHGESVRSESTLRFRDRHEVQTDLEARGFTVVDVRGAPDRPGKELVFLAQRD